MKKSWFVLVMISFTSTVLFAQQLPTLVQPIKTKNSLQKEGLVGFVKEYTQTLYEPAIDSLKRIIAGKRIHLFSENTMHAFNDSGNIEEEVQYKAEDVVMTRHSYDYDQQNKLFKESVLDAEDKILANYLYKYDMRGLISERTVVKRNSKWEYEYDKNGNLTQEKNFADGNLISKIEYKYNANGWLTEETTITAEGKPNIKDSYSHDEKGVVVQRIHSIVQINTSQKFGYTYQLDEQGNWVQKIEFKAGKPYRVYIRQIKYKKI